MDMIFILRNEIFCHAFVYTDELQCYFDIDDLDFYEMYHCIIPDIIKGDA